LIILYIKIEFLKYYISFLLLPFLLLPIAFLLFYINVNSKKAKPTNLTKPTITFIVPYIKFVSYPQEHGWWWWWRELIKPQPSPFVKTINREIYKTWNGEALINFKWNLFGIYYYAIIWIMFTVYLDALLLL